MLSEFELSDAWYCRHPDSVTVDIGEETSVVLQTRTGMYYELEPVSRRIWELIPRPTSSRELCDTLISEYGIGRAQCESDVARFLRQLVDAGLANATTAPDAMGSIIQ